MRGRGLAVGWATIDVERAAAGWRPAPDAVRVPEPLLGGRAVEADGVDGLFLVEPATEGRVAASLARNDEGPATIYLRSDRALGDLRAAGLVLSAQADGPFGPEVLVLGGSRFGPHVVLVLGDGSSATDTIDA